MYRFRIRAYQKTLSLVNGDSQQEAEFPKIDGSIIGYGSKIVGSLPTDETCDLTFKDGGQNISDPLDVSISEITTKNGWQPAITPMPVPSPGSIKVVATPSATLGSGDDYKVKVWIWYAEGVKEVVRPSDCI